jgi:phosphohistidine phosphatase
MKLHFLRHGIAADRAVWDGEDAERPLTVEGRERVDRVAKAISRLGLELGGVIASPYLRAKQTAEVLVHRLGIADHFEVDERLAPGFCAEKLNEILIARLNAAALLLVGHEPDFSDIIADLTGGGQVRFKKAGLARVDIVLDRPLRGELIWLIPPKLLLGLREVPN